MAIEKLERLPGIGVAEAADAPQWGQICMVPVSSLAIDRAYQREVGRRGAALVKSIVAAFDPAAFGCLTGRWEGDAFAIIDGQHRALAALHLGLRTVPAMEVLADPATLFGKLNRKRVQLTSYQQWRAAAAAGDESAVVLREVADVLGIQVRHAVSEADWQPGVLTCIGAALRVARDGGRPALEATLDILLDAERDTEQRYLIATIVRALGLVVAELLAADESVGEALDSMAAAIVDRSPEDWLDNARAQAGATAARLADAFRLAAMRAQT